MEIKLNRNIVRKNKKNVFNSSEFVSHSKSELLSFMWELTKDIYSLTGSYDVESRLQRDVISIIRKKVDFLLETFDQHNKYTFIL
ncbi:MAG: hypothetical protein U9R41_04745 [Candidatus Marinimicrobia bacterium]|nr:hypothetical protein [Candidatus Neomarinimicrobiota bacterium]